MSNLERAAALAEPAVIQILEHRQGRLAVKIEVSSEGMVITYQDGSTLSFPELTCGSRSRTSDTEYATVIAIAAAKMITIRGLSTYDRLEETLRHSTRFTITRNENGALSTTSIEE